MYITIALKYSKYANSNCTITLIFSLPLLISFPICLQSKLPNVFFLSIYISRSLSRSISIFHDLSCCAFNFVCRHLHSCIEIAMKIAIFFLLHFFYVCVKSRAIYKNHLIFYVRMCAHYCKSFEAIAGCFCCCCLIVQRKSDRIESGERNGCDIYQMQISWCVNFEISVRALYIFFFQAFLWTSGGWSSLWTP